MLNPVNPNEPLAVARLLEFLSERRPWYRCLWGIGVVLAMDELYEACTALRQGHLSEASVKRMVSSLQKRVGLHPAFLDAEKRFLNQQIQNIPRADGAAHFGLRELSTRVSQNYLARWARAVAENRFSVEHFARNVAAYLLDLGFSGDHLHAFIERRLDAVEPISLAELCNVLHDHVAASPRREFEVLLAFSTIPEFPNGVPASWLKDAAVTQWLQQHDFPTANVRAPVGMLLKVQARDDIGAAQAARDESDRYAARALIGTGKPLDRLPMLWVQGTAAPQPVKERSRGVGVRELFREDRVFSAGATQSVDAALELLAHMEDSSPPAAVAGGWAAIEGLLADPSDRASAADNLATLVTCSFPRAELTSLSYRAQKLHPAELAELPKAGFNRERCSVLAKMIHEGRMPAMDSLIDQAAVLRLRKLLADPAQGFQTLREAIGESFHRLYRQRNLILHGARLDSVVLAASLRTVAKLVGAGMDRITHGSYVQNVRPLELVAKANLALTLMDRHDPSSCVELLETR